MKRRYETLAVPVALLLPISFCLDAAGQKPDSDMGRSALEIHAVRDSVELSSLGVACKAGTRHIALKIVSRSALDSDSLYLSDSNQAEGIRKRYFPKVIVHVKEAPAEWLLYEVPESFPRESLSAVLGTNRQSLHGISIDATESSEPVKGSSLQPSDKRPEDQAITSTISSSDSAKLISAASEALACATFLLEYLSSGERSDFLMGKEQARKSLLWLQMMDADLRQLGFRVETIHEAMTLLATGESGSALESAPHDPYDKVAFETYFRIVKAQANGLITRLR